MEEALSIDPALKAFQLLSAFEVPTVDEKTRNWKGFLAHLSTLPSPLPQSLKLCVFFRVKQQAIDDAKVTEIVAAPSAFGTAGPFPNRGPSRYTAMVAQTFRNVNRSGGARRRLFHVLQRNSVGDWISIEHRGRPQSGTSDSGRRGYPHLRPKDPDPN